MKDKPPSPPNRKKMPDGVESDGESIESSEKACATSSTALNGVVGRRSPAGGDGSEDRDDDFDCHLVPALLAAIWQLKKQKSAADANNIIGKVYRSPNYNYSKEEVRRALDQAVRRGLVFKLYMNTGSGKPSYFDPALMQLNKNRKLQLKKQSDMTKLIVRVVREWCGSPELETGRTLDEIYTFIQRTFSVEEKGDLDVRSFLKKAARQALDQNDLVMDTYGRYSLGPNALDKEKNKDAYEVPSVAANGDNGVDEKWELSSSNSSRSTPIHKTPHANGKVQPVTASASKKTPYKANKSTSSNRSATKICQECRKAKNQDGTSEALLICNECGRSVHPSCLSYSPALSVRLLAERSWLCACCKPCAVCSKSANLRSTTSPSGSGSLLILCDKCDKGFHSNCLQRPPAGDANSIPECGDCASARAKKQKTEATRSAAASVRRRYKAATTTRKTGFSGRAMTRKRSNSERGRGAGGGTSTFSMTFSPTTGDGSPRLGLRAESAPELKGLTDSLTHYFTPTGRRRGGIAAKYAIDIEIDAVKMRAEAGGDCIAGEESSSDSDSTSVYSTTKCSLAEKERLSQKNPQLDGLFDSLSGYFSPQSQQSRRRPPRGQYADVAKGISPNSRVPLDGLPTNDLPTVEEKLAVETDFVPVPSPTRRTSPMKAVAATVEPIAVQSPLKSNHLKTEQSKPASSPRKKTVESTEQEMKAELVDDAETNRSDSRISAEPEQKVRAQRKRRPSGKAISASAGKRSRSSIDMDHAETVIDMTKEETPTTSTDTRVNLAQSAIKKQRKRRRNAESALLDEAKNQEKQPKEDVVETVVVPIEDTTPRPHTLPLTAPKRPSGKLLSKAILGGSVRSKERRKKCVEVVEKPPEVSKDDRELFAQASKQAEKSISAVLVDPEQSRCPSLIQFGSFELETWYSAPYPHEYARLPMLYICEFCLKYMKSGDLLITHTAKCSRRRPPATEIYRDVKAGVSVFEVDGNVAKSYCQNLCLLAKLFLDHKTLYYDVEPFLFYVVTKNDEYGQHFVGYFSKEKYSAQRFNLSCIVTLPCYQKQGFGRFLIDFSFLLSRKEGLPGTPERPLSDLGKISYASYWRSTILEYLQNHKLKKTSIKRLSTATGVALHDITDTLLALQMLVRREGKVVLEVNWKLVSDHHQKVNGDSSRIWIDELYLDWKPTVYSPTKSNDARSPISSASGGRGARVTPTPPNVTSNPAIRSPVAAAVVQDLFSSRSRKDAVKSARRNLNLSAGRKKKLEVATEENSSPAASDTASTGRKRIARNRVVPKTPPVTAGEKKLRTRPRTSGQNTSASESGSTDQQDDEDDDSASSDADSTCRGEQKRRRRRRSSSSDSDEVDSRKRNRKKRPSRRIADAAARTSSATTGNRRSARRSNAASTNGGNKRAANGRLYDDDGGTSGSNKESDGEDEKVPVVKDPSKSASACQPLVFDDHHDAVVVEEEKNESSVAVEELDSSIQETTSSAEKVVPLLDEASAPNSSCGDSLSPSSSNARAVVSLSVEVQNAASGGDEDDDAVTTEAIELSTLAETNDSNHNQPEEDEGDDESTKSSRCSSRASEEGPPTLQRAVVDEHQPLSLEGKTIVDSTAKADPEAQPTLDTHVDRESVEEDRDGGCTPPQLSPILLGRQEEAEEIANGIDHNQDDIDDRTDIQEIQLTAESLSLLQDDAVTASVAVPTSSLSATKKGKRSSLPTNSASEMSFSETAPPVVDKEELNPNPVINIVADSDTEQEWPTGADLDKPPRAPAMVACGEEADVSQDALCQDDTSVSLMSKSCAVSVRQLGLQRNTSYEPFEQVEPPPTVAALQNLYEHHEVQPTVPPPQPPSDVVMAPIIPTVVMGNYNNDPMSNSSAPLEYPVSNQPVMSSPSIGVSQTLTYNTEAMEGVPTTAVVQPLPATPMQTEPPCLESPPSCHQQQRQSTERVSSVGFVSPCARPPSITHQPQVTPYCNGISETSHLISLQQASVAMQQHQQQQAAPTTHMQTAAPVYSGQQQPVAVTSSHQQHHSSRRRADRSANKKTAHLSASSNQQQQLAASYDKGARIQHKAQHPTTTGNQPVNPHQQNSYNTHQHSYQNGAANAFSHSLSYYPMYDAAASYQAAAMYNAANPWSYSAYTAVKPPTATADGFGATPGNNGGGYVHPYFNSSAAAATTSVSQNCATGASANVGQNYLSAAAANNWFSSPTTGGFQQFNRGAATATPFNGAPVPAPTHFPGGFYHPQAAAPYFAPNPYLQFSMNNMK